MSVLSIALSKARFPASNPLPRNPSPFVVMVHQCSLAPDYSDVQRSYDYERERLHAIAVQKRQELLARDCAMVESILKKHGRLTLKDLADLCGHTPKWVRPRVKALADENRAQLIRITRSYYVWELCPQSKTTKSTKR